MNHDSYDDAYIKAILEDVRVIAMVGASTNWTRPSYFAMKYLQTKGYRVIPVNPRSAGENLLGEIVVPDLEAIDEPIDMVDVFRKPEDVEPIAQEAIDVGAKVLWMQLGVRNDAAADVAETAGLQVVMNRCPKIEYARLFGEIGRHGIASNVITSRKRPVKAVKKLM